MNSKKQYRYEKVILGLESLGFTAVIAVLWLDEYVDVPFRFFGAPKTPLRPQEFWFEALTVLFLAIGVIVATLWTFQRLRLFEGFVQVCAWCRKVRVGDEWVAFEQYLKRTHDVHSTHDICPTCREQASASRRESVAL